MEKNYFLNLFNGVKRSFTITSEKKVKFFLGQSLSVLLIVLFLPFKSVEAIPIDVGFLPKYITENLKESYTDPVSMLIIVPPLVQEEVIENHTVVLQNSIFAIAVDTDDDGEPDSTDIDDDNDGVLDTDEGFCALQKSTIKYKSTSSSSELTFNESEVASAVFQFSDERVGAGMLLAYASGQRNYSKVNQSDLLGATSGNDFIEYSIAMNQYASGNLGTLAIKPASDAQTDGFTITTFLYKGTTASTPLVTSTQYFSNVDGSFVQVADFSAIEIEASQTYIVRYHIYNVDLGATVTHTNGTRHQIFTNCYLDSDNDGIPNHLDLDSDGDGCSDAVEAGNTSVNDNATTVFKTGVDANRNGLIDDFEDGTTGTINYESNYNVNAMTSVRNACADTDGDGVGDLIDIDDDNDGVLDTEECNDSTTGNLLINGALAGPSIGTGCSFLLQTPPSWTASIKTPETFSIPVSSCMGAWSASKDGGSWVVTGGWGESDGEAFAQTVTRLTIGQQYVVRFEQTVGSGTRNTDLPAAGGFWDISFGNESKLSPMVNLPTSGASEWFDVELVFTATAVSQQLQFKGRLDASTTTGVSYMGIDGITLSPFFEGIPCDIDNDGIPNNLDLDSDGDGCSDAVESGNTVVGDNNITVYPTGIDANNNGLLDKYEDGTSGEINYNSKYTTIGLSDLLNACVDSDNDGVGDLLDLDDDNDGVRDSDESPTCFGTKDIYEVGNRSARITVSSGLNMNATYNQPRELVDGDEGTTTANYAVKLIAENISNIEIFRYDFDAPIELSTIYLLYKNVYTHFNSGVVRIQGSNNGTTWITLSEDVNYTSTSTKTGIKNRGLVHNNSFNITQNQGSYTSYRLMGVSGNSYALGITLETIFEVDNFIREWYPLATCEDNEDLDGDGVVNHLDTDMDGDGCLDIVESGAGTIGDTTISGNVGQNGWADNLETFPDSGIINYELERFYLAADLNSCLDTDGDGIGDLIDVDDDNDGVLDVDEADFCPIDLNSESYRRWLRQTITITTIDRNDAPPTQIRRVFNTLTEFDDFPTCFPTQALSNNIWFEITFPEPIRMSSTEFAITSPGDATNQRFFANGTTVTMYGVNARDEEIQLAKYTEDGVIRAGEIIDHPNVIKLTTAVLQEKMSKYIFRASGSVSGLASVTEIYFDNALKNCVDFDTDNDGIINRLDLDSDGDGCADAVEASNTLVGDNNITEYPTGADANNNGLLDKYEDGTSGEINYDSSYVENALSASRNACADTDGDGIGDLIDIDDDNDGVLDTEENCDRDTTTDIVLNSSQAFQNATTNLTGKVLLGGGYTATGLSFNYNTGVSSFDGVALIGPFSNNADKTITLSTTLRKDWGASGYGGHVKGLIEILDTNKTLINSITWEDNTSNGSTDANDQNVLLNASVNGDYYIRYSDNGSSTSDGWGDDWAVKNATITTTVCSLDSDEDGILNSLDLDSDDDGCSDAVEAGNTLVGNNNVTDYPSGEDANGNGLLDKYEDGTSGEINYISRYTTIGISDLLNACDDSDNDGIGDLLDLDDDNDGIRDSDESSTCFGTKDIYEVGNRSERITVSSGLNMNATYNQPNELVDGDEGTTAANYAVKLIAENISNKEIFRYDFDAPIELSRIYLLYKNLYTHFNNGVVRIQGSNNGTNWTTLSADVNYTSTSTKTGVKNRGLVYNNAFNITQNQGTYTSYRLMGVSGNSYALGVTIETIFEVDNFIREWYPLATCEENSDLDDDGILNHLDTDMDGDGCLDIVESGAGTIGDTTISGNVGLNGWADNLETAPDSGIIGYELERFYMAENLNSCLDTDGDGIGDLIDIDDDNDGVLDTEESDFCPIDLNSESYRRWLRQTITITTIDRNDAPPTQIRRVFNTLTEFDDFPTCFPPQTLSNNIWFEITFPEPISMNSTEFAITSPGDLTNQRFFANGTTVTMYGVNASNEEVQLAIYTEDGVIRAGEIIDHPNVIKLSTTTTREKMSKYIFRATGAVSGLASVTEIYFDNALKNCVDFDTDGDGIINRLDLDSDGDECSDAVEAGNTLTSNNNITDYPTGADVNNNGLLDKYEDGTSGEINYESSYTLNAISAARNACADTDGDGIGDLIDIDDDNDGVLDVTEMYSCFISSIGDRTEVVEVSTSLALGTSCIFPNSLVDGVVNDTIVRFGTLANQSVINKTFLKFAFKQPVCLKKIYLQYPYTQKLVPVKDLPPRLVDGAFSHFLPGTILQLQGSNDGATWTNLNSGTTYGTDPTLQDIPSMGIRDAYLETYSVSLNNNSFSSYRIQGISGSTSSDMSGSIEVYFETCQSCDLDSLNDTDQDGILNSLDLDSDGDGCSDAVEASNTLVGNNNITDYPTGVDANNNGLLDIYEDGTSGEINYDSTYTENALDDQRDACADTDGDGIGDLIDLDDDNDGVLDVDECSANNLLKDNSGGMENWSLGAVNKVPDGWSNYSSAGIAPDRYPETNSVPTTAYEGLYYARFFTGEGQFQNITTETGMSHTISFQYTGIGGGFGGASIGSVEIWINDILIDTTPLSIFSDGWQFYTISFIATGPNTKIGFRTPNQAGIDDFNIVALTCDTDKDGIPDRLDLDSDNDGIFDAVEAGHGLPVHPKGHEQAGRIIDGSVGGNGFVDVLETGTETGEYISTYNGGNGPVNSDGEDTIDATDLDSDNDGCLDVEEAYNNFQPEPLDTNGDGTYGGTGTEADGYVNANGIVTEALYTEPADSNNDGGADYTQMGLPLSDFARINSLTPLTIEKAIGDRHIITASLTSVNLYNVVLNWQQSRDEGGTWNALENDEVYSGVHEPVLAMKNITKEMNNSQYKLAIYANNNVCSNIISDDTSVLLVKGCEINLTDAVFEGLAPINCDPTTDGTIAITNAGLVIGTSYIVSYSDGTQIINVSPNPVVDTEGILNITGLSLGDYSDISIKSLEYEDCTEIYTGTVTINTFESGFTVSVDKKDETFFNANDGEITLVPSGGVTPYVSSIILNGTSKNLWTGETTTGLSPGVYIIKVIDANKCEFIDSLIVVPVPACSVDVVIQRSKDSIDCYGDEDITLTAVATIPDNSSATHPLSYTWFRGELEIGTGLTISNLGVGAYKVVITSGAGDTLCEGAQEAYIIEGPKAVLNGTLISGDVISVSPGNEGFVEVTATGGTAPYSYAWKNSTGATVGGDTARIENLVADVYAVIITDKNGCTTAALFKTVAAPGCFTINNTVGDVKVDCFGDRTNISVTIANGSGDYTIAWSSTTTSLTEFVTNNLELTQVPTGTYKVDITDNGLGCSLDETINVTSNEELSGTFVATHVFCKGDSTGALDLKIAGGDGKYTYLWSSTTTNMDEYPSLTVQDLGNLPAGDYNLLVTDGNGCEANIAGTISEPLTIIVIEDVETTGVTCMDCDDGKIVVTATGGTGTHQYMIDENTPVQTSNIFLNLKVGTYTITVFDENGCFVKRLNVKVPGNTPPDYKPVIYAGNTQIDAKGNVDFSVLIGELLNNNSNGIDPVSFRIIKNGNVNLIFDETMILLDGRTVNNPDWVLDNSHSFFMEFTYVGNGGIFIGDTASIIGISAHLISPNTEGVFPISVTVKFGSGGEIRTDNNGDKELIKYTK